MTQGLTYKGIWLNAASLQCMVASNFIIHLVKDFLYKLSPALAQDIIKVEGELHWGGEVINSTHFHIQRRRGTIYNDSTNSTSVLSRHDTTLLMQ